jgi:hypothetical protein
MANDWQSKPEAVNHPSHYGGKDDPYEHIKVVRAWGLNYELGNATKYICRAGKKDPAKTLEDLEKAAFYLNADIEQRKAELPPNVVHYDYTRYSPRDEAIDYLLNKRIEDFSGLPAVIIGSIVCRTSGCNMAPVYQIGQLMILVCEKCGGHWTVSGDERTLIRK